MRTPVLLAALAAALLTPATATAGIYGPSGPQQGVRLQRLPGEQGVLVRFTGPSAKAVRDLGGRRIRVSCQARPVTGALGWTFEVDRIDETGGPVDVVRLPPGARSLRARINRGYDTCFVATVDRIHVRHAPSSVRERLPIGAGALTARGRVWLDEWERTFVLDAVTGVVQTAAGEGAPAAPAADAVVADGNGVIVALDAPDAAPPPNKVGYWSDGVHHYVISMLSDAGRRLFLEDEGDGVVRSNVLDFLAVGLDG